MRRLTRRWYAWVAVIVLLAGAAVAVSALGTQVDAKATDEYAVPPANLVMPCGRVYTMLVFGIHSDGQHGDGGYDPPDKLRDASCASQLVSLQRQAGVGGTVALLGLLGLGAAILSERARTRRSQTATASAG
jgi:hypothetical protein